MRDELLLVLKKVLKEISVDLNPLIERPKDPNFGDYTTNVVLQSRISPRETLDLLNKLNENKPKSVEKIELKGSFINFWLTKTYLQNQVLEIEKLGVNMVHQISLAVKRQRSNLFRQIRRGLCTLETQEEGHW